MNIDTIKPCFFVIQIGNIWWNQLPCHTILGSQTTHEYEAMKCVLGSIIRNQIHMNILNYKITYIYIWMSQNEVNIPMDTFSFRGRLRQKNILGTSALPRSLAILKDQFVMFQPPWPMCHDATCRISESPASPQWKIQKRVGFFPVIFFYIPTYSKSDNFEKNSTQHL